MDSTLQSFEKRQKALRRKHKRMAQGYVNKLDRESGLIVQRPDNKVGGYLTRLILLVAAVFMGFKVFLLAGLGEATYLSHVDALRSGSVVEQGAALVMQIDPVSAYLAPLLQPLLQ
ncbi:hypothetical protein [Pacificoceanicola onchidii]|uniref:hypothetical protein n=1 Tax=Pacificoceanicola onchidii TaxID=2562685 RepID=UPI0010A55A20|nr:hypothetical protein [Pacificoceanicola onchidii]